jgi:hypothetical protein
LGIFLQGNHFFKKHARALHSLCVPLFWGFSFLYKRSAKEKDNRGKIKQEANKIKNK